MECRVIKLLGIRRKLMLQPEHKSSLPNSKREKTGFASQIKCIEDLLIIEPMSDSSQYRVATKR